MVILVCILAILMGRLVGSFVYYYCDKKEKEGIWESIKVHKKKKIYILIQILEILIIWLHYEIFGWSMSFILYVMFVSILLSSVFIDSYLLEVPGIAIMMLFICAITSFLIDDRSYIDKFIGAGIISVPFFIVNLIRKDSIGEADIMVVAICGLLFGASGVIPMFCVSYIVAGIYVLIMLVFKKLERTSKVAMMPFFFIGVLFQIVFNISIIMA